VRASAGTRDGCNPRVRNAASDNTDKSREGVGVGLVERGAANGSEKGCGRPWSDGELQACRMALRLLVGNVVEERVR
jgi:hypothetical protein